jgi:hypothetical protein
MSFASLARTVAVAWPLSPAAGHPVPAPAGAAVAEPPGRQVLSGRPTRLNLVPAVVTGAPPVIRHARPSLRGLSFMVLVLIPIAVAGAYYFAVASDQYIAEFRFTLNTVDPPRVDPLSLLVGNAMNSPVALESQILVQYMTSRAVVDEIGASIDLRRLFAPPEADWWARLPRSSSIEELVHYWRGQVDPSYDPANGTVTVRLRAFAPADALRLSQAVVAASEARHAATCRGRTGASGRSAQIRARRDSRVPRSRGPD